MASAEKQTFEKGAIVSADSASLIALAAEVAKHDEKFQRVKGVKGGVKIPRSVKKPTIWKRQNAGLAGRSRRNDGTSTSLPDDPEGQAARKAALERKSKMYEMLKRSGGDDMPENLKDELLVEFDDPRRWYGRDGRLHSPANPFPVFRNQEAIQATEGRGTGGPGYSQANTVRHYNNATERRARGVGFYAFSQDEDERARQMRELLAIRSQTETSRSKYRTLKDKRRDEIQARKILIQQKRLKSLASTVAA
ncbi:hypothetical protein EC991_005138 [Linnemannia zychae]|nr:hypothetical protein EC991_005138 [Linnemannia zychae]